MRFSLPVLFAATVIAVSFAKDPDPARFEKTIVGFEAQDKKTPPPKDAILFTGSSSITLWRDVGKAFPQWPTINRGFGGSTTPEVNHFAERIVLPYKPRIVVLYSGSNDIAGGREPEQVLSEFRVFVKKIHDALPETKIVYISIHTPPGRLKLREAYESANTLIAAECKSNSKLVFADIRDLMLGKDGQPNPDLYRDPLHPTPAAYDLWRDRLAPLLK